MRQTQWSCEECRVWKVLERAVAAVLIVDLRASVKALHAANAESLIGLKQLLSLRAALWIPTRSSCLVLCLSLRCLMKSIDKFLLMSLDIVSRKVSETRISVFCILHVLI